MTDEPLPKWRNVLLTILVFPAAIVFAVADRIKEQKAKPRPPKETVKPAPPTPDEFDRPALKVPPP